MFPPSLILAIHVHSDDSVWKVQDQVEVLGRSTHICDPQSGFCIKNDQNT
jgi:hypothetical protein